jgi:hypothetical protein
LSGRTGRDEKMGVARRGYAAEGRRHEQKRTRRRVTLPRLRSRAYNRPHLQPHEQPSTEERRDLGSLPSFLILRAPSPPRPPPPNPSSFSPSLLSSILRRPLCRPSRSRPAGITCYSTLRDLALSSRPAPAPPPLASCNPENEILRAVFLPLSHPSNSARARARRCAWVPVCALAAYGHEVSFRRIKGYRGNKGSEGEGGS